jgi:hypothetical protein
MSEAAAALAQAEQQQPASGRQRGVLPDEALCGVDVSGEDATVCAGAWRSYMVVFSTPWNDSLVRMIALYKCEEVRVQKQTLWTLAYRGSKCDRAM